jgi:hypothetical protein
MLDLALNLLQLIPTLRLVGVEHLPDKLFHLRTGARSTKPWTSLFDAARDFSALRSSFHFASRRHVRSSRLPSPLLS